MTKHPSISALTATGKVNFMLFGPYGVGKTSLIAEGSKVLIIRPPTDHTDAAIRAGSDADEWVLSTWNEMNEVEEYARHNPTEYDWIWLDSLSLMQDHLLEDIMDRVVSEKPHRLNTPISPGEYGENMEKIKRWVRHMVGIQGFNFGITCHPADLGDNKGDAVKLRPWIQGKNMAFNICGYMNIVGYMEIVQEKRVIRFTATDSYEAKDQFNMFPNFRLVNPTMAKIEAALPKRGVATKAKEKPVARRRIKRKAA